MSDWDQTKANKFLVDRNATPPILSAPVSKPGLPRFERLFARFVPSTGAQFSQFVKWDIPLDEFWGVKKIWTAAYIIGVTPGANRALYSWASAQIPTAILADIRNSPETWLHYYQIFDLAASNLGGNYFGATVSNYIGLPGTTLRVDFTSTTGFSNGDTFAVMLDVYKSAELLEL